MQRSPFLPILVLHILRRLVLKNDTLHLWVLNVGAGLLDDLYICDGCDGEGVPELMRSSGKHTEEHHLIRCLAPEKTDDKDEDPPTGQRLTSMEGRLGGVQKQLDDLSGRVGDLSAGLSGRIEGLTGRMGDLTGYMGDINARIGNIEQLLHRLVGAPEGRTS